MILETLELAKALHRGGGANYLWHLADKQSTWYTGDLEELPDGEDWYWNVHPVAGVPARGHPGGIRGRLEEIARICCLFAEFDSKDFGDSMQAILDHIEALPVRPTALVNSGHGYHAYWLLTEPLELSVDGNREQAANVQASWVRFVGADEDAKDLARILRVPGTVNAKAQPVRVELLYFNPEDEYALSDLVALVPDDEDEHPPNPQVYSTDGSDAGTLAYKLSTAIEAMPKLSHSRADHYEQWVEVGMALRELDRHGLILWDEWSQKSAKYQPGACAHKWETFSASERGDLTVASLKYWAEMDSGTRVIPKAPKTDVKPSHYMAALKAMKFEFTLNLMADEVYVNGMRQTDIHRAVLFTELREHGYTNDRVAENAWITLASRKPFHPVRDFLNGLTWDGNDYIGALCGHIDDGGNLDFNCFLRRWLIGAVARPMAGPNGVQSRAFVLNGLQGIGKSRFVRYLGSALPQFYMESGINTEDKDFLVYLANCWIWEVAELGSTLRKADREALKHYLSRQTVAVRRAYGRYEIRKPAIAAFMPTINNEAGFLWDPTGYRRFMVATVEKFDWAYETNIDVNGIWAQAVAAYKDGEPWELTKDEAVAAEIGCQEFEVDDPLVDFILELYDVNPVAALANDPEWFTPTSSIVNILVGKGRIREASRREAMQIGGLMLKLGCTRGQLGYGAGRGRGYYGIRLKPAASVRLP